MGPHPKDFDDPLRFEDLVDKSMLDVNSSGVSAGQVTNQLFVGWRILEGILSRISRPESQALF